MCSLQFFVQTIKVKRPHLMGVTPMKYHKVFARSAGICLSAAGLLAIGVPAEAGFLTKSLQICDQGSFFIGGVPKTTKFATSVTPSATYQQITVGQMYVGFQVPEAARKWPLILV